MIWYMEKFFGNQMDGLKVQDAKSRSNGLTHQHGACMEFIRLIVSGLVSCYECVVGRQIFHLRKYPIPSLRKRKLVWAFFRCSYALSFRCPIPFKSKDFLARQFVRVFKKVVGFCVLSVGVTFKVVDDVCGIDRYANCESRKINEVDVYCTVNFYGFCVINIGITLKMAIIEGLKDFLE